MSIRLLATLAALAALLSACSASDLASTAAPSPAPSGNPSPIVLAQLTPLPPGQPGSIILGRATQVPAAQPPAQPQWGQRAKTSGCAVDGPFPDSACSPGDVFPQATKAAICVSGYSRTVRDVPTQEKDAVYAAYGIASHTPGQYEVDHLVSLELGGSNDISNLWPEAAAPKPGFHEKDEVENALHDQVCSGQIDLPTAQREIATDWLSVYDQIHGLPSSAHVPAAPGSASAPIATAPATADATATVPATGQGAAALSDGACPPNFPIKGNIRSDGAKIYHLPNDPTYARTHAEQCFATAADAQAAGFRAPR
jgi:hypothetical protein